MTRAKRHVKFIAETERTYIFRSRREMRASGIVRLPGGGCDEEATFVN